MKLNPFIVAINYFQLLLTGNIRISGNAPINDAFPERFQSFLYVKADTAHSKSPVRLLVKFKVGKLNLWHRKIMPVLGIPFFAGAPGFMEKVFLLDETDKTFSGFYTWRSREDAETYTRSYPAKIMAINALPNTLTMEISAITE